MVLVVAVRWSFRGKDAGSVRIEVDTDATEDAVLGASSAARRHSHYSVEPSSGNPPAPAGVEAARGGIA